MVVYLWQHGVSVRAKYPPGDHRTPSNLRPVPRESSGKVSERPIDAIFNRAEPPLRAVPSIALQGPASDADIESQWEERADVDGLAIGIIYRDVSGQQSERTIRCDTVHFDDGHIYVEAWCLLRKAQRTFRLDRIEAIFDYHSGQLLGDPREFYGNYLPEDWQERGTAKRRATQRDIVREFGDGAKVLMFLAMEDGELDSTEHRLILA
jgi:hypothetical protein